MKFSIVIPIHNEESSIIPLYSEVKEVMGGLNQLYEVIFVDDCSADNSLKELKRIEPIPGTLLIISLNKKCGQAVALQAGFDKSRGELIITMDGDLQNSPRDIPKLIEKLNEGFDVVCGWRCERQDPRIKVLTSKIIGYFRSIITSEKNHDFGCALKIFKKKVLKGICFSKGMHRFFTLIMIKLGYRVGEVKIKHYPRTGGKSKYNIHNRVIESLVDFICLQFFGVRCLMKVKQNYKIKEVIKR